MTPVHYIRTDGFVEDRVDCSMLRGEADERFGGHFRMRLMHDSVVRT